MNTPVRPTAAHAEQYKKEGYFVLENCVSPEHLELLRNNCQFFIDRSNAEMDAQGVDSIGLNHRNKRYFAHNCYRDKPEVGEFIFSDLMADVCRATIGNEALLFWDQYVVKCSDKKSHFSWHQDSGFVHLDCPEYLTCWVTLDDVTEENGTVYLLPYSSSGIRSVVKHIFDPEMNDMVGYFGKDPGIPIIAPAGSIACFSSYVFHRSGPNLTNRLRRVFLPQYSPVPIHNLDGTQRGQAIPFLKGGKVVYDRTAKEPALA